MIMRQTVYDYTNRAHSNSRTSDIFPDKLLFCVTIDMRFTGLETDHVLSLATNNRGALTAE